MRKWIVSAVLLTPFVVTQPAPACECGSYPTGLDALKQSEVVARGELVQVRRTVVPTSRLVSYMRSDTPLPFLPANRLTFAISAVWKGEAKSELVLYQFGCCVCEAGPFKLGQEYLLYAVPHKMVPSVLMASMCFPNKPVSAAAAELAQLGRPIATPSWTPEKASAKGLEWIAGIGKTALAKSIDLVWSGYVAIAPSRPYVAPTVFLVAWLAVLAAPVVLLAAGIGIALRLRRRRSDTRRPSEWRV